MKLGRCFLLVFVGLSMPNFAATVSIVLLNGAVVDGRVESGIPTQLSMVLPDGTVVVLNISDLKMIRFQRGEAEVESWAGQIYKGTLRNLGSMITVTEKGGATRFIPQTEISYIQFLREAPTVTPTPALPPTPTSTPSPVIPGPSPAAPPSLIDLYKQREWSFFLGLGYAVAGLVQCNGFGYPQNEAGVNITLGVHWRFFILPSVTEVEARLGNCGASTLEQAKQCLGISRVFYVQLATDLGFYPSLGVGVWVLLGTNAFLDLGVLLNLGLLGWGWVYPIPYLGVGLML